MPSPSWPIRIATSSTGVAIASITPAPGIKSDEANASDGYAGGLGIVQACLGPERPTTHPAGQTGRATRFAKTGGAATVEVRYYKERYPSRNWQTSLMIGPPVTRDAR
jgi:hypothetical protein